MTTNGTISTYQGRTPQALTSKGSSLTAEALAQRSIKAIDLFVAGNPLPDIAEALGCSIETVESITSNPLAKARILQLQIKAETTAQEASMTLSRLTAGAAQVMSEALEGNLKKYRRDKDGNLLYNPGTGEMIYDEIEPKDRIKVAQDILDRNRETARVSKSEVTQDTSLVDSESLIRVKENYRQALQQSSINTTCTVISGDTPSGDDPIGESSPLGSQEPAPFQGGQPDGDKS